MPVWLSATSGARRDDGAAAVEFALVVPFLVLLAFGIIQFGITFGQVISLNNASRQAARVGVVALNQCSSIMTQVKQAAPAISLRYPLTVSVARGATAVCTGRITSAGAISYTVGAASTVACPAQSAPAQLTVRTTAPGSITIPPFIFVSSFNISGNGVFTCES